MDWVAAKIEDFRDNDFVVLVSVDQSYFENVKHDPAVFFADWPPRGGICFDSGNCIFDFVE